MDIHHVEFPFYLPSSRPKRALKVMLGRLLLASAPDRRRALEAGLVDHPFGRADRLRVTALVDQHLRAGTMDRLAAIQERFWAGQQATLFHAQAEARFKDWWVDRHSVVAEWMKAEMARAPGQYRELVEVGCGSGLVLADLAARLPELQQLTGIDLSAEQIQLNRHRFTDPRLRFESGDAAAWIERQLQPGSIVFTNAGVLEYFATDKLRALFANIARRRPAAVVLVEPLGLDYDPDVETEPRPYSAENSLSRPYTRMLREAGFTVRQREDEIDAERRRLLCLASVDGA